MQNFCRIFSFFPLLLYLFLLSSLTIGETHSQSQATNVTSISGVPSKGRSTNIRVLERKIKENLFSGKYDKEIRPGGAPNGAGPTEVTVNLLIRSMGNIDDFKMEYTVQLTMREEWLDPRLRFTDLEGAADIKYITITDDTSIVWMPDIFFLNEKEGRFHNIIKPNTYIRIAPEGLVMYSIRISLALSCPMYLALFPMDTQTCSMTMASYGWTTEDLIFRWKIEDPVEVANISLPRFSLKKVKSYSCDRTTTTGSYSCLRADLHLIRNFSYYLIQMYVPCVMLVIVSWISFYLDENAIPARTALGITTLLTMATQAASMKSQSAAVSYTKAMDVWSTTCLVFVFAALMEFAVVDYCRRYDKRKVVKGMEPRSWWFPGIKRTSKKVDVTARILFPTLFFIFNICYWSYYLTRN